MSKKFNEHNERSQNIMRDMEIFILSTAVRNKVHFKKPYYDIARRFLNEIVEFEEEGDKC